MRLVEDLGGRGEKLFDDNISKSEQVVVKVKGSLGEGLVITDKRLYVLKWGFMAGSAFGGRCMAFEFKNISSLEIKKNLLTGTLEVLTAATQNSQNKNYFGTGQNSAIESDNIVTFQGVDFKLFQEVTNIGRDMINKAHNPMQGSAKPDDSLVQLEKLAELKEKGIITEDEFVAKKKQMLGL